MMKYLLFFAGIALLASGCSEEYLLERKEDKLTGAWEIEKVFYKSDRALFRDNVTDEYRYDVIEFYSDYTAEYFDYSLNVVFPGDWLIRLDRDNYYTEDGSGSNMEYFIDAVFYDMFPEGDFAFFGSIDRLNKNSLNFEARDRRGTYTFKLCRR
jgi:hypothetical protein